MRYTICCDLKTRKECYVIDGLVFIPYDKKEKVRANWLHKDNQLETTESYPEEIEE